MMGDKTKYGYEAWFGFSIEMRQAVQAAMDGATYEVQHVTRDWAQHRWTETKPIRWSIRWNPDIYDGVWVLYVSAQAAVREAERLATRAVRERLQPGTRVRLAYQFHGLRTPGVTSPAGLRGWVSEVDWQRGVSVLFDGISGERDLGKFFVVPDDDAPQRGPGPIYADHALGPR